MNIHAKQIKALRLAIETLTEKRRPFAAGELAYQKQGIRPVEIQGDGITGIGFLWVTKDHEEYKRYNDAIHELEDLIDVLEDPGVTYDGDSDLPLFAGGAA